MLKVGFSIITFFMVRKSTRWLPDTVLRPDAHRFSLNGDTVLLCPETVICLRPNLSVKDGYRNNKIPVDCIVQDWHYWDGAAGGYQGCYCWNTAYGDVKKTIQTLHNANIHTMISIWSQLEEGSPPFNNFKDKGWLWPNKDAIAKRGLSMLIMNRQERISGT